MNLDGFSYEQGPIRPPSEAASLLIRATRNCPWNRCAFCHCYRGSAFELRPVEEIKKDIDTVRNSADELREISWKLGEGGRISKVVLAHLWRNEHLYGTSVRTIAAWLYYGGESVFLQDANSIIMKTADIAAVLRYIRERLPTVTRITSYGRSKTAAKKSVEEYRVLREAGLTRIHIGLESGGDRILAFMNKGVTAADHIEGGKRIVESGISLSEYIMPGLGGSRWTEEHARETARVINAINPDFVRIRSLQVVPGTALSRFVEEKRFEMLTDDGVVKEIRLFIECLDGVESTIVSDHILNLLEEVEGTMPADREKMCAVIDRYLALPEVDREVFRLGRRRGMFSRLDDLNDDSTRGTLRRVVDTYRENDPGGLERDLRRIMEHYI